MERIPKDTSTERPLPNGFTFEKITGNKRQLIQKRKGKYDMGMIIDKIQEDVSEEADLKISHADMSKQSLLYFTVLLRKRLSQLGLANTYSARPIKDFVVVSKKLASEN